MVVVQATSQGTDRENVGEKVTGKGGIAATEDEVMKATTKGEDPLKVVTRPERIRHK